MCSLAGIASLNPPYLAESGFRHSEQVERIFKINKTDKSCSSYNTGHPDSDKRTGSPQALTRRPPLKMGLNS